jgi:hypothetical protein
LYKVRVTPSHHTTQTGELEWLPEGQGASLVAMALRANPDDPMPHVYYENLVEYEAFCTALSHHYVLIGKPLQGLSREQLLEGYWHVVDKTITCNLDKKEVKTEVDFDYATEVVVKEPFMAQTLVQLTVQGRVMVVDDLKNTFAADGVLLPADAFVEFDIGSAYNKIPKATPTCDAQSGTPVAKKRRVGGRPVSLSGVLLNRLTDARQESAAAGARQSSASADADS